MHHSSFRHSLDDAAPPPALPLALQALWWDGKGDWDRAHQCAQDQDDDLGAAVACPERRVVNLEADGSAMYTLQGLWTQARENLDVTTLVFANRKYAILLGELAAVGANPGRAALDMMDLSRPDLDFVRLAEGTGVPEARAETMERFNDLFVQSVGRRGPFLIELATP